MQQKRSFVLIFESGIIVLNCLCAATDFASGSLPSVGHVDHVGRVLHVTGFQTGGPAHEDVEGTEWRDDAAARAFISLSPFRNRTSCLTLHILDRCSIFKLTEVLLCVFGGLLPTAHRHFCGNDVFFGMSHFCLKSGM